MEGKASSLVVDETEIPLRTKADPVCGGGRSPQGKMLVAGEIAHILEPWFHARTLAEVGRIFEKQRVTWAPYRTVREAIESDPDCSPDNPMFSMEEQPGIGTDLMLASPLDFSQAPRLPARPAPRLGEHTDEILLDILGLSEGEVGKLHDEGIVAGPELSPS